MIFMRLKFTIMFALATIVAAAQNPPRQYLADSMPSAWRYVPETDGKTISVDDKWWTAFDDSLLDSLVDIALKTNYDVRAAARRVIMARAEVGIQRSEFYPQVDLYAGAKTKRNSGRRSGSAGIADYEAYWEAGVDVNWQIDLFGKIAGKTDAKNKLWQASQAEWAGVMLTVAAETVTHYVNARQLRENLDILNQRAKSQLAVVRMVETGHNTDAGSSLQVSQALTLYYTILAQVPVTENLVQSEVNALAILLGLYPGQLDDVLIHRKSHWPNYRQLIASGVPSDLLRRRPDIVEAERLIASYAAQLGVAKKEFLPNLSIEGTISTSARAFGNLFDKQAFGWEITPKLSWNLFDGYNRRFGERIARETLQEGIDNYNFTVLNACRETSEALSGYASEIKHINILDDAVAQADKALSKAIDSYKASLCDFSTVNDAQSSLLTQQTAVAQARRDALLYLVKIYVALGGGWDAVAIAD